MSLRNTAALHAIHGPFAFLVAYCLTAAFSVAFTQGTEGLAATWPASGLAVACLMLTQRRYRANYLVVIFVATVIASIATGATTRTAIPFGIANTVESWIAILIIERTGKPRLRFDNIVDVGRMFLAAISACLISGTISATLTQSGITFALTWWTVDALGILIVTPIIISLVRLKNEGWSDEPDYPTPVEALLWIAAIVAITASVFAQADYPLLFVPPAVIVAATYRLGHFGASLGIFSVTVVSSIYTGVGAGPAHFVDGGMESAIKFLQFYLTVQLVSVLPLSAAMSARKRLSNELEQNVRLLRQAEATTNVGHWRLHLETGELSCSDEVYRIHGTEPGQKIVPEKSFRSYRARDEEKMRRVMRQCIKTQKDIGFDAVIRRPDGELRHIQMKVSAEVGKDGRTAAVFGTTQDITWHVEAATAVKEARDAAEAAARKATDLANTDQLTGLPNRRRTMQALEEAIEETQALDEPLSVAIFDIDHFKAINDNFGHAVGDMIIRCVGQTADAAGREDDFVGRIGGEEFVMLLPTANAHFGMVAAERVRAKVQEATRAANEEAAATVSIGVATYKPGMSAQQLLDMADRALYAAKDSGRNAVHLFQGLPAEAV
ncbi:diguanylate cyclase [Pacificimonas sp. WHA3]|uniref:diguanylate cyclase n=1 Tax=Pacificimonas pallii TaxID=2827236 RepID=A0ABS6SI63_9SPHN|nr:diguanylate cyclase [Pacificimonas pallii]MBV7257611.1 diguanylate cyclase [Pacificimonas pallii]